MAPGLAAWKFLPMVLKASVSDAAAKTVSVWAAGAVVGAAVAGAAVGGTAVAALAQAVSATRQPVSSRAFSLCNGISTPPGFPPASAAAGGVWAYNQTSVRQSILIY